MSIINDAQTCSLSRMHGDQEPIFEIAPATSNDDNDCQRFFNKMVRNSSDPSNMASGSTTSLSGSVASRSIVSSLTSSSITLNSDKEVFLRNALRRAKLLQEYHSKKEQEEVVLVLSQPQPSPEPWLPQEDDLYSDAGYHCEKGIIQIENARINARHASRKLKVQFRHAKSDDIVDSMLLNRRLLLQRPKSIDTTLQRISQEQNRCRERLRLLKAASKHQCVDQSQGASQLMSECLSDYVGDDDDDSSGYFSSDSALQSTGSIEEVAIKDVPVLDDTGTAPNIQGNGCDNAFVVFPASPPSEKDLHTKSQGTISTRGSSPQTPPDVNVADLSTEEMSYLIPISLFEGDGASSSIIQSDDHSSSANSREFHDVWAWIGNEEDGPEMAETKRSKTRRAQVSKILCFRMNKRNRYAAMDDQMSLLSEV